MNIDEENKQVYLIMNHFRTLFSDDGLVLMLGLLCPVSVSKGLFLMRGEKLAHDFHKLRVSFIPSDAGIRVNAGIDFFPSAPVTKNGKTVCEMKHF